MKLHKEHGYETNAEADKYWTWIAIFSLWAASQTLQTS